MSFCSVFDSIFLFFIFYFILSARKGCCQVARNDDLPGGSLVCGRVAFTQTYIGHQGRLNRTKRGTICKGEEYVCAYYLYFMCFYYFYYLCFWWSLSLGCVDTTKKT